MRNARSLGLVLSMISYVSINTAGLMVRDHCRRTSIQIRFNRRWLSTLVTWAILMSSGVAAQAADEELIEEGRRLFIEETFEGNGRTCATCHPPSNNFTLDPTYIRTLKGNDPLFLTGPSLPELKSIEVRRLLKNHALILENVDGFDQPGALRSVPHTLALRTSLEPDANAAGAGITHATGWSGDGSPGRQPDDPNGGSIRNFAIGAVIQHFTKSENRVEGVYFRLPTDEELVAMAAFQLSLGRQEDVDITGLSFTDDFVNTGRNLFITTPAVEGTRSCNFCHNNAGAMSGGVDRNFGTGTNKNANVPACLLGFVAPYDGGFGVSPKDEVARAEVCGKGPNGGPKAFAMYQGDMTMNTPPLIEAADTGPFFHNNSAATLEEAVAFYNSGVFGSSQSGGGNPFDLDQDEINQIAAFLRALSALENIRSSNAYDERATDPTELAPADELVDLAIAETTDAIEVLTKGPVALFAGTDAVRLLHEARLLERQALEQAPPSIDLLKEAIALKQEARIEMVGE